jgi:hypothetical protein
MRNAKSAVPPAANAPWMDHIYCRSERPENSEFIMMNYFPRHGKSQTLENVQKGISIWNIEVQ